MIKDFIDQKVIFTQKNDIHLREILDQYKIDSLSSMNQTHSNTVLSVDKSGEYQCDALISKKSGLGLLVKTADCLPILVKSNHKISAIHAGWRGLQKNIDEIAFKNFKRNSKVFIGPHAKSCCYEVKYDVAKYFKNFIVKREEKLFLDLESKVINTSKRFGFDVEVVDICTICNTLFNSFRRDHTKERQFGLIWL